MSGSGTFTGTSFQAKAIAYTYVHILGQRPLLWIPAADDTPLAISGETSGPGDDAAIYFGDRVAPLEVQAKHGLKGGEALGTAVRDIAERMGASVTKVVLAVDPGASKGIRLELAVDLDRIRSGRFDGLRQEAATLKASHDYSFLSLLHVVTIDMERESAPATKLLLLYLEEMLHDKAQASVALDVLVLDAHKLCAEKRRHTRDSLVQLLASKGIALLPQQAEEHRRLDVSRAMINNRQPREGLAVLDHLERSMSAAGVTPDPTILYRIYCQRANAALQLDDAAKGLTYAQRAIDLDPDRFEGLLTAGNAAAYLSDISTARRYVTRALKARPHDANAWGLDAHLRAIAGEEAIPPPPEVAGSPDYILSQVETANIQGDRQKVKELARTLLKMGERSPDALNHLATSLLDGAIKNKGDSSEDLAEADRLLSEVVDSLSESDPRVHRALSIRAGVRHLSGRLKDSDADLAHLRNLGISDPELTNNLAIRRLHENDPVGALAELQHPLVQKDAALLLLRAQANFLAGNPQAARRDFDSASALIDDTTSAEILGAQAEAALNLGDGVRAEQILLQLGSRINDIAVGLVTKARLAFSRGDTTEGTINFRRAADLRRPERRGVLLELAGRLRRANQLEAAIEVFGEAGGLDLPDEGLREYATALQLAERFSEAKKVIDHVATKGSLPDWAINIDLQLAISSSDIDAAIAHLRTVIATRPQHRGEARVALARHLAILDHKAEAYSEIIEALRGSALEPEDRAHAAQVLAHIGHADEALAEATLAYRESPNDKDINRTLIQLALSERGENTATLDVISSDTYVVLDGPSGDVAYTIWSHGPINTQHFELSPSSAEKMGLLGKRVGDEVVLNANAWNEKRYRVSKIESSHRHLIADVVSSYEARFPGDDFIHGFKAPDGKSVGDLREIISTLEGRRKQHEHVFSTYWSRHFPLGWVATILKVSIQDVMATLSFSEERRGGVAAEWQDAEGQKASLRAAQIASTLVLTRSALETAERLDLLPTISARYQLVAPHMLIAALSQEAHDAQEVADHGRRALAGSDKGIEMREIEAGHPLLIERARKAKERLTWCRERVKLLPRPLQFLGGRADAQRGRDLIGHDSWDSVEIAIDRDAPLWTDDLGLRCIDVSGQRAQATSTVSLLASLREAGKLHESDLHKHLHTLIVQRYRAILPTRELLVSGILRYPELGRSGLSELLSTLCGLPTIGGATDLFSETLRAVVMASVEVLSLEDLTNFGLEAMSHRWPRVLVAQQLHNSIQAKLALLPLPLRAIQRTCTDFARRPGSSPA